MGDWLDGDAFEDEELDFELEDDTDEDYCDCPECTGILDEHEEDGWEDDN